MRIKLLILTLFFLLFGASSAFASNVVINEFMAHPSTENSEWVEFYNPNNIDLSSYWIDDDTSFTSDSGSSTKKSLSSLNTTTSSFPYIELSSFLNNPSDYVVLFSNDGTIIDQYQYTSDPGTNVTIGRSPDGGSWTTLATSSKGNSNGGSSSTLTPSPTPTPTSTSSPSPTSSSSSITSSFIVSDIPSQINSDQSFTVLVNLSLPNNPGKTYYLSGAFKIVDGTRYFGLTKINSDWISYNSTNFSNQYKITTDSSGVWNGNLEVKPDATDYDYKGTGDYTFKVARYTQAGSQTWSNDGTIKIIGAAQGSNSSKTLSNDSPSPNSTTSPSIKSIITTSQNKNSGKTEYKIASIAGVTTSATPTAQVSLKSQKQTDYFVWAGIVLIFTGTFSIGYIYLRKHASIHIKFRKRD